MQKFVGILFLLGLLTSCGQRKAPVNDPRFDIYKDQFQSQAAKRGLLVTDGELSIPISFGETGAGTDGICVTPAMGENAFEAATNELFNRENFDRKFILINPSVLEKDLFYIEAVVFHELAHCLLGREHTDERSLMNVSQDRNSDYPFLRKVFLDELFGLNPDFENTGIQTCPRSGEYKILEQIQYDAFDRQLNYVMFTPLTENSEDADEIICINSYLK